MRLKTVMRGSAIVLAFLAPAWAADVPSLSSIAAALQAGRAADAEAMATAMLAVPGPVPLEHAYLLLDRGLAWEQLHHREAAADDFSAAIESKTLAPAELARAVFDRGAILDEMGRTEEAIADYSHALELSPRYAAALNNRANAYRRIGRYALARTDYQAALAAGDDEPEYPLYGLGRFAEAQGDPSAAKTYYQRVIAANGMFTPVTRRLASLEPMPEDVSYALRSLEIQASTPENPQKETAAKPAVVQNPASTTEAGSDDLGLRPAILNSSTKPVRASYFAPVQRSASASVDGGDLVQLGAWRNEGEAALSWNRLSANAGALLSRATPDIVEADVPGKGRFWRLRTRAPSGTSADAFCAQLRAKGLSCVAVHS